MATKSITSSAFLICIIILVTTCYQVNGSIDWSTLTATELSNISAEEFTSISSENISSIPSGACSGFRAQQITSISDNACIGFKSACFKNIPPISYAGFTAGCVSKWKVNEMNGIVSEYMIDHVNNIVRSNFAKWTTEMMAAISDNGCQGINLYQMNDLYGSAGDSCAGFTSSCIANIPAYSFSALNPGCINNINMFAVTAAQFNVIPSVAFPYVYATTIKKLSGSICSGFTSDQLGKLTGAQCTSLLKECAQYIPKTSFGSITTSCFLNTNAISGLNKDQIANIPRSNFALWNKDMMSALNSEACKGINIGQLNDLYGSAGDACVGFTSTCIANIPADSFMGLNPGCINNMNLTAINSAQLAAIPYVSFPYVTEQSINKLSGPACAGITNSQIGQLTTQCQGFKKECISYIPADRFSNINSASCFFSTNAIPGIKKDQLTNINRSNFAKWSKDMMAAISDNGCQGINIGQLNDLYGSAGDVCVGFTSTCIANIPAYSFMGLNPGCLNNINLTAINVDQLAAIPYVAFPYITEQAVRKLNGIACSGITASQISQLTTQCTAFNKGCLSNIPADRFSSINVNSCFFSNEAIPVIKREQLTNIPRSNFAKWSKEMMALINENACQGITIHQLNDLYGSAGDSCAGFTSSCIANIPAYSFSALNPGCINNINMTAVSAAQFNVIPYNAFPYVLEGTLSKLRGSTCSGVTGNQLSQLTLQCNGFTKDCLANIPADSIKSVTSTCLFSTSAIPGLSKEQINNVNRANFAKWTKEMMSVIEPNSCKGINLYQMNDLYGSAGDSCAGFTSPCIENIPVEAFSALNPGCINNINMTAVSAAQFNVIPYNAFPYVLEGTIRKLKPSTCYGVTGNQLSQLTTQCNAFSRDCLYYIPSESFKGITTNNCFFSVDAIPGLRKEQITNIDRTNFAKWTKEMMSVIEPDTCKGINLYQMNDLYGSAGSVCAGFTSSCIANIPDLSFSALNPGCINNINMTAVSSVQFTAIPSVAFNYIYTETIAKLRGNICSGFTNDQLASLSTQCSALAYDCISKIELPALERISPNCFKLITPENILGFTADQIPSLSAFTISGITSNQLITLYNNPQYFIAELLTSSQLESVASDEILSFKKPFESGFLIPKRRISSSELSNLTWLQLAVSTKLSVSSVVNNENIFKITFDKTFQGFRTDQISVLEDEIFRNTNVGQLNNLLVDSVSGITVKQMSYIPLEAFSTKEKAFYNTFNSINPLSIPGITQNQLSSIINGIPSTLWTCEQFTNLTSEQIGWFKTENVEIYNLSKMQFS
ncbi:hypothetical protein ABK040_006624 [Willaertia magna]